MSLNHRFTIDHSSFEKLLAAAWVLQCAHDQLHDSPVEFDERIAELVESEKAVETANPSLQGVTKPPASLSLTVTGTDSEPEVLNCHPVRPTASLLPFASRKADEVELRAVELKQNGHPVDAPAMQASPSIPVVEKPGDEQSALRQPSLNLRITLDRAPDVFRNHQPIFRINLTLRALRAAIATPVLLLAMVAALLLLEAWRNEPFHNAQATSNLGMSDDPDKRTADAQRRRPSPLLEVSHMRSTDPVISSVVQELSRYEIRGLQRQAKYGDASAAFTLGTAFETGRYLRQSCTEAARWVAIAAESGSAPAQYNLGLRYRDGDGVAANRAESEKWLRKASAGRNPQAQLALKMLASR